MKSYSCKWFTDSDNLLRWLNNCQDYINVVSIMYVDSSFHYEVIYYTEEEFKNGHE